MKTKKSGAGAKDVYCSKWEHFGELAFLFRGMNEASDSRIDSMAVCTRRDHIEIRRLLRT